MNLAEQAYDDLYGSPSGRNLVVTYHGNVSPYNATATQSARETVFRLSTKLKHCEPEIQMGVIQYLLNRLNKTKVDTDNIELYHSFVRKMSDYAPVSDVDEGLAESFQRVNEEYFSGLMLMPNLVWGKRTKRLMGTYTYGTDTIMISRILEGAPEEILDYVMYHEMLHKKHKFSCSSGRTHSHTPAFKKDEAKYAVQNAEQLLNRFLAGARTRKKHVEKQSFLSRVMGWK